MFSFSLQPAENNHMDACELTLCYGCKKPIEDHYRLRVSPDMEWHTGCLACSECQRYLDETCTCFMRDGRPYCRRDYVRQVFCRNNLPAGSRYGFPEACLGGLDHAYHLKQLQTWRLWQSCMLCVCFRTHVTLFESNSSRSRLCVRI